MVMYVGIRYSMRNLICDVIVHYALCCDAGKMKCKW